MSVFTGFIEAMGLAGAAVGLAGAAVVRRANCRQPVHAMDGQAGLPVHDPETLAEPDAYRMLPKIVTGAGTSTAAWRR